MMHYNTGKSSTPFSTSIPGRDSDNNLTADASASANGRENNAVVIGSSRRTVPPKSTSTGGNENGKGLSRNNLLSTLWSSIQWLS